VFGRILVPLDGSQLAEVALPHARHLAEIFHSRLVLVQVLEAASSAEGGEYIEPLSWQIRKAEADLYLRGLASKMEEDGQPAEHYLLEGRTAEAIVQFAQNSEIDLVIMSSHGQSGLSRWNISSVVSKVVEKVYLPVMVVRAYQALEETSGEVKYKKVLLPHDLSRRSECSLPVAVAITQADEGEMLLAHVLLRPEVAPTLPESAELNRLADEYLRLSQQAYGAYMDELCERVQVSSQARLLQGESIPRALHELIEQENVDLVVMCAHGHGALTEWPYGSVPRHFIEQGSQPVLVLQDVPRNVVRPTAAEIAAQKYGSRG